MIFNEIKCHINTSLGMVGGCIPCIHSLCPRLYAGCAKRGPPFSIYALWGDPIFNLRAFKNLSDFLWL